MSICKKAAATGVPGAAWGQWWVCEGGVVWWHTHATRGGFTYHPLPRKAPRVSASMTGGLSHPLVPLPCGGVRLC